MKQDLDHLEIRLAAEDIDVSCDLLDLSDEIVPPGHPGPADNVRCAAMRRRLWQIMSHAYDVSA